VEYTHQSIESTETENDFGIPISEINIGNREETFIYPILLDNNEPTSKNVVIDSEIIRRLPSEAQGRPGRLSCL
jgi:hypothetical protein